jgi:hypothetical protein
MAHHEDNHGHDHGHDNTEGSRQYYPKGWWVPLAGLALIALCISLTAGFALNHSGTDKWGKHECSAECKDHCSKGECDHECCANKESCATDGHNDKACCDKDAAAGHDDKACCDKDAKHDDHAGADSSKVDSAPAKADDHKDDAHGH